MRRTLAAVLLALFSFSLIAPAVFASDPESNLPACCRRLGKHRCVRVESSSVPSMQAPKCTFYPQGHVVTASPNTGLLKTSQVVSVFTASFLVTRPASETWYRVSYLSTCPKRGPPGLVLA